MRRIILIAITASLFIGCGDSVSSGGDGSGEAEFRTVVKTQLLTQPGMNLFCQSIRGSSDREVLTLMAEVLGQGQAKALNINPGNDAQLHGAAIIKEECARVFGSQ